MPKVAVYNINGGQVGEIELNDAVWGIEPNKYVLHQAVVMQLASRRLGTHATKTRGMVRGGGRKPWRQKGTGRARHGSIRSPIWRGGGTVFGPHPRKYGFSLPKKVRRLAMKSALSSRVKSNDILVLDSLDMSVPKTKEMVKILSNLNIDKKALIVTAEYNESVFKSARNIPYVTQLKADKLNVYDVLNHQKLIITKDAVAKIEEVLAE
ncbi:50S ribosomal protein L4 [Peptococcaceae bacterium]|nr:50S ribosomal protein L4 [Peptococcaceae bacterium]MCL0062815.1 50S ribosomal protein L4 [Peptococcaceae bacterium]MCL0067365.1 50S ribosomal protein L4 [Peptococcaceae bacterium]MCL0100744.1 50S ribosomal protein L4 [Peptococcaceae bacterium]MCL0106171.1 50S ribosomal protein L4 [Peptococcaceae bacterium]